MIKIYHKLGLLDFRCENIDIINDELVINNGKYTYKRNDTNTFEIQKGLFHLKQTIIENNLFGVDINPKSVEICKLRLWIELLKNSYYLPKNDEKFNPNLSKEFHQMQTLPNIDINIKCGNSLLNNIELSNTMDNFLANLNKREAQSTDLFAKEELSQQKADLQKKFKLAFDAAKEANLSYKNSSGKEARLHKDEFEKQTNFLNQLFLRNCDWHIDFYMKLREFFRNYGYKNLKTLTDEERITIEGFVEKFEFHKTVQDYEREKERIIQDKDKKELFKTLKTYEETINTPTFEWRFEFPEVLNENGEFMGFDLVVGNPPYIDYRKIDEQTKGILAKNSVIYKDSKEGSIYVYFIERSKEILSKNGSMIFINPISYICQEAGFGLRNFIDKNLSLNLMLNVSNLKVFDSAATYTCINHFTHKNKECKTLKFGVAKEKGDLSTINLQEIEQCKIENLSLLLNPITTKIFKANYPKLNKFCEIFCGLSKAGFRTSVEFDKKETNHPFLEASDIFRYEFKQGKFLSQIPFYYSQDKINIFENKEIIFMARMTNFIRCCVAPSGYFGGKANVLYDFKVDKRYILGLLNSKLMSYFYAQKYFASHMQGGAFGFDTLSVGNLPIPKITKENQHLVNEIINLVDKILDFKKADKDITELESKIDDLVYQLYSLNKDEISIINA